LKKLHSKMLFCAVFLSAAFGTDSPATETPTPACPWLEILDWVATPTCNTLPWDSPTGCDADVLARLAKVKTSLCPEGFDSQGGRTDAPSEEDQTGLGSPNRVMVLIIVCGLALPTLFFCALQIYRRTQNWSRIKPPTPGGYTARALFPPKTSPETFGMDSPTLPTSPTCEVFECPTTIPAKWKYMKSPSESPPFVTNPASPSYSHASTVVYRMPTAIIRDQIYGESAVEKDAMHIVELAGAVDSPTLPAGIVIPQAPCPLQGRQYSGRTAIEL